MESVKVFFLFSRRPSSYQRAAPSPGRRALGDGVDHAAVEQRHGGKVERRIGGGAVAAVAVLQHGGRAVALEPLLVDQRHGDFGPVARGRPDPFGYIVRRVVAQHRLALQQLAFAGLGVELIRRRGRGQRGVACSAARSVFWPVRWRPGPWCRRLRRRRRRSSCRRWTATRSACAGRRSVRSTAQEPIEQSESVDEDVVVGAAGRRVQSGGRPSSPSFSAHQPVVWRISSWCG